MSLYYEAAAILSNASNVGGSLKSRIYNQAGLKSSPAQIYALVSEASKWSYVLKDAIERSDLLAKERKLTPVLALVLTHDLLIAKSGVAAPAKHVLKLAINRHKARLSSEFTKTRIRRGYATMLAFKKAVDDGELEEQKGSQKVIAHPRWVRVNTLKTSMEKQLATTFHKFKRTEDLAEIMGAAGSAKMYFVDPNIPSLLALPPKIDLSKSPSYAAGDLILQDKASCFPAYLLDVGIDDGDVIDGCAAPGNKTTHLAALLADCSSRPRKQTVIAFERDKARASTLQKMVKLASADSTVLVKIGADFLAALPDSAEFSHVGAILLDPSCSGSGIVGRDDVLQMHLPVAGRGATLTDPVRGKKRKHNEIQNISEKSVTIKMALEDSVVEETPVEDKLSERLAGLSSFQLRILTHAMHFPQARKITYSTCSMHFEENEGVVLRALASEIAKVRGWKILGRKDQVQGLREWSERGNWSEEQIVGIGATDSAQLEHVRSACIRCVKGTTAGTMGFFVAAFVRDSKHENRTEKTLDLIAGVNEEDWKGFSDSEFTEMHDTVHEDVTAPLQRPPKKRKKRSASTRM